MTTNTGYFLDSSRYTLSSALLWGIAQGHFERALDTQGSLGGRVVHLLTALVEFIPILSQIVSLFEYCVARFVCDFSVQKENVLPIHAGDIQPSSRSSRSNIPDDETFMFYDSDAEVSEGSEDEQIAAAMEASMEERVEELPTGRIQDREIINVRDDGNCMLWAILLGIRKQPLVMEAMTKGRLKTAIQSNDDDLISLFRQEIANWLEKCPERRVQEIYTLGVQPAIRDIRIGDDSPLKKTVAEMQKLVEAENQRGATNLFAAYISNDGVFLDGFVIRVLGFAYNLNINIVGGRGERKSQNSIASMEGTITLVHGANHYQYLALPNSD